jgi:hypothetical protein
MRISYVFLSWTRLLGASVSSKRIVPNENSVKLPNWDQIGNNSKVLEAFSDREEGNLALCFLGENWPKGKEAR